MARTEWEQGTDHEVEVYSTTPIYLDTGADPITTYEWECKDLVCRAHRGSASSRVAEDDDDAVGFDTLKEAIEDATRHGWISYEPPVLNAEDFERFLPHEASE